MIFVLMAEQIWKKGSGNWQALFKVHQASYTEQKLGKFDDTRAKWWSYENMLDKDLCSAGLACKHD
jgi:hypothetical protein